jgi:hypothetical protein
MVFNLLELSQDCRDETKPKDGSGYFTDYCKGIKQSI